ncbi:hypothetical protein O181_050681 [Austropuccinia psidii MF-1]|uniref:Uncharacterized protein n=1 Tax=Austropuccinia psidii MF-1 TaxID=1389203 RepID=A0A9Q3E294_9BASI|nr:hypothetical protein [Austropuccinia psidii MF-1]
MPAPPSRCDCETALITPYPYNPYAPTVPSRYTSYAALNPCYSSSSLPLTILMLAWCPPDMPPTLPPISALITPYASTSPPLTMHMLPRRPQDIPLTPPSSTRLILFTDYHPYALAVSS